MVNPALSLGELYMDGRLVVTRGDLYSLLELGARNLAEMRGLPWVQALHRDSRRLSRPAPAQRPAAREAQHRQSLRPRRAPLRSLPRFGPPVQLRLFRISRPIARRRADGEEAPYRRQAPAEGRRDGARHRLRFWRPGALSRRGRRSQGHRRHPVQRAIHRRDRSRAPGGPGRPGRISAPGLPRR